MLSSKVKNYAIQQGWWDDSSPAAYEKALLDLGVDIHSDFAEFFYMLKMAQLFWAVTKKFIKYAGFF